MPGLSRKLSAGPPQALGAADPRVGQCSGMILSLRAYLPGLSSGVLASSGCEFGG